MRPVSAIAILAAASTLAGCGASAQQEIKAKLQQFARAASHQDYGTICRQVLAPSLVEHLTANGIACEEAMQVAFNGVTDPSLSVGKVTIKGQTATAVTLSMARNQPSELDAIKLVNTDSGWRVSALASPLQSG
jgi:hypothetical protein